MTDKGFHQQLDDHNRREVERCRKLSGITTDSPRNRESFRKKLNWKSFRSTLSATIKATFNVLGYIVLSLFGECSFHFCTQWGALCYLESIRSREDTHPI